MAVTVIKARLVTRPKIDFSLLSAILLLTVCSEAYSGEWQFVPRAKSSLSYVDNINLATNDDAESSRVFELTPGFSLNGTGSRLRLNADYQLQSLFYSNNPDANGDSDSKYFHRLSSSVNSELVERLLFIDASASASQQSSTEIGKGTADNFSLTDDRGTVKKLSFSPYFLHQVGKGFRSELRFRYDELDGEKNVVANSTIQTVDLKMNSGNLIGRWQLSLTARNSEVDYQSESDQTLETADVGISRRIFTRTIISLHGGTEKVKYHPSSVGETGGDYWLLNMAWRPGNRTFISLEAGERYYGESYGFAFEHKSRRAIVGLEYKEDLTNSAFVQFEQRMVETGTVITSEGDIFPLFDISVYPVLKNEVILRKTFSGNVKWSSAKSTINLGFADVDLNYDTSDSHEETQSVQTSWQWRTSQTMTFDLSGYYQKRKLSPVDRTESISQTEMKLSHTIWPGASTSVSVASSNRNVDDSDQDYSQKRFAIAINMKW